MNQHGPPDGETTILQNLLYSVANPPCVCQNRHLFPLQPREFQIQLWSRWLWPSSGGCHGSHHIRNFHINNGLWKTWNKVGLVSSFALATAHEYRWSQNVYSAGRIYQQTKLYLFYYNISIICTVIICMSQIKQNVYSTALKKYGEFWKKKKNGHRYRYCPFAIFVSWWFG